MLTSSEQQEVNCVPEADSNRFKLLKSQTVLSFKYRRSVRQPSPFAKVMAPSFTTTTPLVRPANPRPGPAPPPQPLALAQKHSDDTGLSKRCVERGSGEWGLNSSTAAPSAASVRVTAAAIHACARWPPPLTPSRGASPGASWQSTVAASSCATAKNV